MQQTIAVAILAGGHGRRMGGADKALVHVAGRPLLDWSLQRLRPQATRIVLSANGEPGRFAAYGLPVVADAMPDAGPLGGIASAAEFCAERWPDVRFLLTVPVDVPCPPSDLVVRMAAADQNRIAVAETDSRMQWAVARWPMDAALDLTGAIGGGLRRVEAAVRAAGYTAVPFKDAIAFTNINSTGDIKTLERRLTML